MRTGGFSRILSVRSRHHCHLLIHKLRPHAVLRDALLPHATGGRTPVVLWRSQRGPSGLRHCACGFAPYKRRLCCGCTEMARRHTTATLPDAPYVWQTRRNAGAFHLTIRDCHLPTSTAIAAAGAFNLPTLRHLPDTRTVGMDCQHEHYAGRTAVWDGGTSLLLSRDTSANNNTHPWSLIQSHFSWRMCRDTFTSHDNQDRKKYLSRHPVALSARVLGTCSPPRCHHLPAHHLPHPAGFAPPPLMPWRICGFCSESGGDGGTILLGILHLNFSNMARRP